MSTEAPDRREDQRSTPSQPAEPPAGPSGPPRLIRCIVCGYSRERLPTPWLQVFRRFDRAMARARLRVRVRVAPLEDLPEDFQVLVVPPELLERARAVAPGAWTIATTPETAPLAVDEVVRALQSGTTYYAEPARPDEPRIVRHRGMEIIS